jgi:hypothetical protein
MEIRPSVWLSPSTSMEARASAVSSSSSCSPFALPFAFRSSRGSKRIIRAADTLQRCSLLRMLPFARTKCADSVPMPLTRARAASLLLAAT